MAIVSINKLRVLKALVEGNRIHECKVCGVERVG